MSQSYIGSRITLTTTSKIRYEGILSAININDSTVVVTQVYSFGTEDRSPNKVPPSNDIIPSITFHRGDIEELVVSEDAPQQPQQPEVGQQAYDPYGYYGGYNPYGGAPGGMYAHPYWAYYYQQMQNQMQNLAMNPNQTWDPQQQALMQQQMQAMQQYAYYQHQQQQQHLHQQAAEQQVGGVPYSQPQVLSTPQTAPVVSAPVASSQPISNAPQATPEPAAVKATETSSKAPAAQASSARRIGGDAPSSTNAATPAATSTSTANAAPATSATSAANGTTSRPKNNPWGTANQQTQAASSNASQAATASSTSQAAPATTANASATSNAPVAKPAWNQIVSGQASSPAKPAAQTQSSAPSSSTSSHSTTRGGYRGRGGYHSESGHRQTAGKDQQSTREAGSRDTHHHHHRGGHRGGQRHHPRDDISSHTGQFTASTGPSQVAPGVNEEFDFASANAAFDKKKLIDELFGDVAPRVPSTSQFWDSFQTDTSDDSRQRDRANKETFADVTTGLSNASHRGRSTRGRGGHHHSSGDRSQNQTQQPVGGAPRQYRNNNTNQRGRGRGGNHSAQTFRPRATPHD